MIYDTDSRASTSDLLNDPYFHHDKFADKYEIELRKLIDFEREKDQSDRLRRKRNKKVS